MGVIWSLLTVVLFVVVVGVAAAVILAVGSLLSHVFAVSAFEAAIVVLVAAVVALYWIGSGIQAAGEGDVMDADEPAILFQAIPVPTRRASRRRKR